MAKHKYIYWRNDIAPEKDGQQLCNVHFLVGYNERTVSDFQKMASELRKTFPQAKFKDITCGIVYQSNYVHGFSIVTWSATLPKIDYENWKSFEFGHPEEGLLEHSPIEQVPLVQGRFEYLF